MPVFKASGYWWWTCEACDKNATYPAERKAHAEAGLARHLAGCLPGGNAGS